MRLYFLRHADALPGVDDGVRPLSAKGRQQAKRIGQYLKDSGIEFDAVYSSPLTRALETAAIVVGVCGGGAPEGVRTTDRLLNEASWAQFEGWLRTIEKGKHALLVGHAPSLEERVRRLLTVANPAALTLPKGGLACLRREGGGSATLKLFLSPKTLPG